MWELLGSKIVKARKEHDCDASHWVSESNFGEIDFDKEDWEIIQKAKSENWKIKKGDEYIFCKGKHDGEFTVTRARLDLNKICIKYDLYCED